MLISGGDLSINFTSDAGSASIDLDASKKWTATFVNDRAKDWCILSTESGKRGTATITVSVVENKEYDQRSASILFTCGDAQRTIVVTQKQKDALLLTSKRQDVGKDGGRITVEVKANVDFKYEIAESAKSWLKPIGTKGLTSSFLLFEVSANEEVEKREGTITITSTLGSETVHVYQEGATPTLILTQNEYTVSDAGGEIGVEIQSNVHFEYEIIEGSDWISEIETKAMSTHTLWFQVIANDTYDERTGIIRIFDKTTDLSEDVTIIQKQKDALLLTQNEYMISDEGGLITIEAQVNTFPITCAITEGQDWLSIVPTKSLMSISWQFKIEVNETYDERIGKISFCIEDTDISEEVTIIQKQKDALLLSQNEYIISDEGGLVTIEVKSNVEFKYDIIEGAEWISDVKTKGLNQYAIQFEVAENEGPTSRIGNIVFYSSGSDNEEGVTIIQQAADVERRALVKIYEACGGKDWPSKYNWCTDRPLSTWYGVQVDEDGHVIALNLSNERTSEYGFCFVGEIPEEIGHLERLRYLNLSTNGLIRFPENVGLCTQLEELDLSWNLISQDIPDSIKRLTNLKDINLFNNKLKVFPKALCECLALEKINLMSNYDMSGVIPEEIGNLKHLEHLVVCNTPLEGNLPKSLLELPCWKYGFDDIIEATNIEYSVDDFVAPDFEVMDVRGNRVSSEELYSKYDYLVLTTAPAERNGQYYDLLKVYKEFPNVAIVEFIPSRYFDAEQLKNYIKNKDVPWVCVDLPQQNALLGNGSYGGDNISSQKIIIVDKHKTVVNIIEYEDIVSANYPVYIYLCRDEGFYQSTDYSHDGEVITLQRATEGKGIDLIIMGDGYSDRMIAAGDYMTDVRTAMEGFFEIEPYKSFRHLFNVYCVLAVSMNEFYDKQLKTETAFSVDVEGANGLRCNGIEKVRSYGRIAVGMDEDRFIASTIITVINSKNGRSVCYMGDPGMAFCVNCNFDENYLQYVVKHEAGGHGFGKLSDEYVDAGLVGWQTTAPSSLEFSKEHKQWHSRNVDTTNDPDEICWSYFLRDARYQNEVGIYEGGYYYEKGVYRPSENSIMKSGNYDFNAPSREAIYYWIHKKAYGDAWEYDFEKFAEYDVINRNAVKPMMQSAGGGDEIDIRKITAPPVRLQDDDTPVVPWRPK